MTSQVAAPAQVAAPTARNPTSHSLNWAQATSDQIAGQPKPTCAIKKPISITSAELIKNVLVTTIAGAKGAVTLSIILTLPLTAQSGSVSAEGICPVTIAAGVILATFFWQSVTRAIKVP